MIDSVSLSKKDRCYHCAHKKIIRSKDDQYFSGFQRVPENQSGRNYFDQSEPTRIINRTNHSAKEILVAGVRRGKFFYCL